MIARRGVGEEGVGKEEIGTRKIDLRVLACFEGVEVKKNKIARAKQRQRWWGKRRKKGKGGVPGATVSANSLQTLSPKICSGIGGGGVPEFTCILLASCALMGEGEEKGEVAGDLLFHQRIVFDGREGG